MTAAGTAALVLMLGGLATTWQAMRATQAKREQTRLWFTIAGGPGPRHAAGPAVGYRDRVFALLEQARALEVPQKKLAELRQEAVACLGNFVGLAPATFADFPTNIESACLAPSGKLAAFGLSDGTIQVRDMPSEAGTGPSDCHKRMG